MIVLLLMRAGFSVTSSEISGMKITSWDLGGRSPMRPLWRHYYASMNGIVFVIDGSDSYMLEYIEDELKRLLTEEALLGLPLLVAVNKMDLPSAVPLATITEKLNFDILLNGKRKYKIIGTSATTDLSEMVKGLKWLQAEMASNEDLPSITKTDLDPKPIIGEKDKKLNRSRENSVAERKHIKDLLTTAVIVDDTIMLPSS